MVGASGGRRVQLFFILLPLAACPVCSFYADGAGTLLFSWVFVIFGG